MRDLESLLIRKSSDKSCFSLVTLVTALKPARGCDITVAQSPVSPGCPCCLGEAGGECNSEDFYIVRESEWR